MRAAITTAAAVTVTAEGLIRLAHVLAQGIAQAGKEITSGIWHWLEPPRYPWEETK